MKAQAGAGLPPGTPDHEPVPDLGVRASATLSVPAHIGDATGPECPQCGATMSRFPLVIYCGFCEFTITAASRFSPVG